VPIALPTASLDDLYALFPDRSDQPAVEPVSAAELPDPYRKLLAHTHHMTVTVEQFYARPVDVRVLDVWHRGDDYARKILLTLRPGGEVVQFGIVRIDLRVLAPTVRKQIEDQKTPLGRVLIQNHVLRTVQPTGYFRVTPSAAMRGWFDLAEPEPTWGRIGVITADGKPAVRVAEVLAPVRRV
jgi:chorismate-pyruvate lyase